MKKFTLLFLGSLLISSFGLLSQTSPLAADYLEINTLKVKVYADGGLWEMQTKDDSVYKNLLFAQNLWVGGYDANSTLHMAAQTYRQSRVDFSPGPISNDPNVYTKYNKVYRIKLQTITNFVNGNLSVIPPEIANWPAHGDTSMGESYHLAPFVDVDFDNLYNPQAGDYPDIKGDEAVFVIFNDKNGKTSGTEMGIEIHAMFYGYKTGGIEDSILYMEYEVFNRSSNSYTDTYFSSFADFDNGWPSDDLTGTNIWANSIFSYNADLDDEGPFGFGITPASSGIRILKGPPADYFDGIDNDKDGCIDGVRDANGYCISEDPVAGIREYISLSNSMLFENSATSLGNPNNSLEHYYYMKSRCKTNIPIQAGIGAGLYSNVNSQVQCQTTGVATAFVYPGNSYDTTGAYQPMSPTNWFSPPVHYADMRMLATAGSFTFQPGDSFTAKYAFVWNRADSNTSGYDEINHRLENLDSLYNNQPQRTVGLHAYYPQSKYRLGYINQKWFIINEENTTLHFKLYNTTGQLVETFMVEKSTSQMVPTSSLAHGVYFIVNEGSSGIHKIMK